MCLWFCYCSSLKSLNTVVQGDVGLLKALLITLTPFSPSCWRVLVLPLLPPAHDSEICLSLAQSSVWRPVLRFHPLTSYLPPVPVIHKVQSLPVLLFGFTFRLKPLWSSWCQEKSSWNEPQHPWWSFSVARLCCHLYTNWSPFLLSCKTKLLTGPQTCFPFFPSIFFLVVPPIGNALSPPAPPSLLFRYIFLHSGSNAPYPEFALIPLPS